MGEKFITSDKIFCHLNRLNDWNKGKAVLPVTVEIHPSNLCDNNCYYCMYAEQKKNNKMLSREQLLKVVESLAEAGVMGIIFSGGGEPLVNEHSIEAVTLAKKRGMDVGFITNGVKMTEEISKVLAENCAWVRFSLDASNAKIYKKIRGVDSFEKVIKNIKAIVKAKKQLNSNVTVGVQCVVVKDNAKDIVNCTKLARSLGVDYIQHRPLETGVYEKKFFKRIQKELKKSSELGKNGFAVLVSEKWKIIDPFSDLKDRGYKTCWCYPFIGSVDAFGDVYICCHMTGRKEYCYGNILEKPLQEMIEAREQCAKRIDLRLCPSACRGNQLNMRLESLKKSKEHQNFL